MYLLQQELYIFNYLFIIHSSSNDKMVCKKFTFQVTTYFKEKKIDLNNNNKRIVLFFSLKEEVELGKHCLLNKKKEALIFYKQLPFYY